MSGCPTTQNQCNPVEFSLDYTGNAPLVGNIAAFVEQQIALAVNTLFTSEDYELAVEGTTTIQPLLGTKSHVALVTVLTDVVAFTSTVVLSHTDATNGKRIVVRLFMPASTSPTVNIRSGSVIGPILFTAIGLGAPSYPSGRHVNAEFVYSSSVGQWLLIQFSDPLIDGGE